MTRIALWTAFAVGRRGGVTVLCRADNRLALVCSASATAKRRKPRNLRRGAPVKRHVALARRRCGAKTPQFHGIIARQAGTVVPLVRRFCSD